MGTDKDNEEINHGKERELIYTYNREMFYHFDKENGFTQDIDYQNPNNQIIIKQSWDFAEERLEGVKQQVIAGKLSPIAYHMERILMEVPMLSAYMEIGKWRVRRHLKPSVFSKLKPHTLAKYAAVFDIKVEELTHPDFLNNDKT
jgi:hypothetical protein